MPAAHEPDPAPPRELAPWRGLLTHARPHAWILLGRAVLGVLGSAAGLAQPLVAKTVIDTLSERQSLVVPLLVLSGLVIAGAPIAAAGRYVLERTTEQVVLGARVQLISRLLRDLATICLNQIQPTDSTLPGFRLVTTPTPIQRHALDLLGVSHRLGIT